MTGNIIDNESDKWPETPNYRADDTIRKHEIIIYPFMINSLYFTLFFVLRQQGYN